MVIEALINDGKSKDNRDYKFPVVLHGVDDTILESLGQDPTTWPSDPQEQWVKLFLRIEANRPVLIGHNVVYDLSFLHSMFIGPLPDNLESFRQRTHMLFPRVLDTKLLVSQVVDPDIIDQSLEDLHTSLECQSYPLVSGVPGWAYNRYSRSIGAKVGSAHNAGFDSGCPDGPLSGLYIMTSSGYMTAMVFLKLATRQVHLQEVVSQTDSGGIMNGENIWQPRWLDDPDRHDPYILSKSNPEYAHLPSFETDFFEPVRNRLRMSFLGTLKLDEEPKKALTSSDGPG